MYNNYCDDPYYLDYRYPPNGYPYNGCRNRNRNCCGCRCCNGNGNGIELLSQPYRSPVHLENHRDCVHRHNHRHNYVKFREFEQHFDNDYDFDRSDRDNYFDRGFINEPYYDDFIY